MRLVLLIVATLLLAGCATPGAPPATSSPTEPVSRNTGHEHSVFRMFARGEEISFNDTRFDFSNTRNMDAHLHLQGSESTKAQYIVHAEGYLDYRLSEFFDSIGVEARPGQVRLHADVHSGRTYTSGNGYEWQLWVDGCRDGSDEWQPKDPFPEYQPAHHDRMLISFAPEDATADSLQTELAAVPSHADLVEDLDETCG